MGIFTSIAEQQILTWTLVSVGIILSIGRYALRYRKTRRFYWDDAAHGLALATMIALCGISSSTFWYIQVFDDYGLGHGPDPLPPEDSYTRFLKVQMSVTILFWVSMYAVKLSFLLLYKFLFVVSTWSHRAWWGILIFTVLTFWACIVSELTVCGTGKNLFHEEACQSATSTALFHNTPIYSCVANVLSDLPIMAFPLLKLRMLQIRLFQKLILTATFCLTLLVMAIDVTRTVLLVRNPPPFPHGTIVGTLTALLSVVETTIAVIISCLPTYRTLFHRRNKPSAPSADRIQPVQGFGNKDKVRLIQSTQQLNTAKCSQIDSSVSGSLTDTVVETHCSFDTLDQGINGGVVRDEETGLELPGIAVTKGWEVY